MDDSEIKRRINSLKALAHQRGHGDEADDFSQWAIVKIWQGRKATNIQLLTDYLRGTYGDARVPSDRRRRPGKFDRVYFNDDQTQQYFTEQSLQCSTAQDQSQGYVEPNPDDDREYWKSFVDSRAQLIIYFIEQGMPIFGIADIMGISSSRVSQVVSRAKELIAANKLLQTKSVKDFEIDWIEI